MRLIRLTLCTGLVVAAKFLALAAVDAKSGTATSQNGAVREVTRAFLLDRIHGGWAGMLIGGLEGLPHEFNLNKTRPSLPAECKVSEQAETLMRVCDRVILACGGERIEVDGQPGYRVRLQPPRLVTGLSPAKLPVILDTDNGPL